MMMGGVNNGINFNNPSNNFLSNSAKFPNIGDVNFKGSIKSSIPDLKLLNEVFVKGNLPVGNSHQSTEARQFINDNTTGNKIETGKNLKKRDENIKITTDVADQIKTELKELKKLSDKATKVIKPISDEENSNISKKEIKDNIDVIENNTDTKYNSKLGIIPNANINISTINSNRISQLSLNDNNESQMKSEFEEKFEYLLDKLNIINDIISYK